MKLQRLVIISFLFFLIAQILTLDLSSASDGNDKIGFPFTFYEYLGGKRFSEPDTRHQFLALSFVADVLIAFSIPFCILFFWKTRKRDNNQLADNT